MERIKLHVCGVMLMMLLSVSAYALDVEDYYTYTLTDGDGYKVGLTKGFKDALDLNCSYSDWVYDTPLPNPAPDGRHNGKDVTDMSGMFTGCYGLTKLDVSEFDTSRVTNMSGMFYQCYGLTFLDVSGFDTSNVTDMSGMFDYCSGLTSLDVNKFDTHRVTNMSEVFNECKRLRSLNVSNFDTSKVLDMSYMFSGCSRLDSLDISNFDISRVTKMRGMFSYCYDLKVLDMHNFNIPTNAITIVFEMFKWCGKSIDGNPAKGKVRSKENADAINASSETTMINIESIKFEGSDVQPTDESYYTYTLLDDGSYHVGLSTDFKVALNGEQSFKDWTYGNPLPNPAPNGMYNGKDVTDMSGMFAGCSGLTILDVSNFDTSNVTNMLGIFESCSKLTALDVSNFDTSKVTNMGAMFCMCSGLTVLNLGNFDTSKVTNMRNMFSLCTGLKVLDISKFDISKVTNMEYMFHNCSGLTRLDMHTFDVPMNGSVLMSNMFRSCGNVTNGVAAVGVVKTSGNADELNSSGADTGIDTSRLKFVDVEHDGVNNVMMDDVKVYGGDGVVNIVTGANVDYSVYSTDGVMVANGVTAGDTIVKVPCGAYVVKIDSQTVKVVVR